MKNTTNGSGTKQNPQDFMSNIPQLDMDMVKNYADSDYVKNYTCYIQTTVNSSGLEKLSMEGSTDNNVSEQSFGKGKMENGGNKNSGDFEIVGYGDLNSMTEFIN